jgi:hypothetical protein
LLEKETPIIYSEEISQKVNYLLEASLKEASISTGFKNQKTEISVYCKVGSVAKNIHLNNFVTERKTRR